MTARRKKGLEDGSFIVGDKKEWRSQIDAPPPFLCESSPPLPQPSISQLPDEGDDMPAQGGYIKSKKVTITMSKTAIFFVAIAQILLGAFFYFGGFGTATYLHYRNAQKEQVEQAAAKEKQAAQKPADKAAPAQILPFGVASISPNPVGIYEIEVKQFRVLENAIKMAMDLWKDKKASYVVGYKDQNGMPLYVVRIGSFDTLDLATQEAEALKKTSQLTVVPVQSKEGEDKYAISVVTPEAGK